MKSKGNQKELKLGLSAKEWERATGKKHRIGKYLSPEWLAYCRETEKDFNGNGNTVKENTVKRKVNNTSRKSLLLATYPECVFGFNRKYNQLPSENHKLAQKELYCISKGVSYSGQKATVTEGRTVVQQEKSKGKSNTNYIPSMLECKNAFISMTSDKKAEFLNFCTAEFVRK